MTAISNFSKGAIAFTCALILSTLFAVAQPSVAVDVASGAVTHSEDPFRRWSPASLTKLMTAYVTFKAIQAGTLSLTAPVRISAQAASQPPSKMDYGIGSVMTVDNALKFLIIKSANDVAVALGEAVSGSTENFVAAMNAQAATLGMTSTNFVNPHGLHEPNQYTTARDLAILARAIRLQYPQYDRYFDAEAIRTGDTVTPTYNILLGRYAGADGMKTGFVCASGFNLVGSATRDGKTVVTVVMGQGSQKERTEKSATLLEDAFARLATGATLGPIDNLLPDPAIAALPPADISNQVCTEEARAQRWDGRAVEGYITFSTPIIGRLDREPRAIAAGLGGADGQSAAAIVLNGTVIKSYPVPMPKPERVSLPDKTDLEQFGLRPGFDVPVPVKRPDISSAG